MSSKALFCADPFCCIKRIMVHLGMATCHELSSEADTFQRVETTPLIIFGWASLGTANIINIGKG